MTHPLAFDPSAVASRLQERLTFRPEALLVLGSGLSGLTEEVEDPTEVPYAELPGFPDCAVSGHAGHFVGGRLSGRAVLLQAGRFHLYEGHPPDVVCGPVRVAHELGVRTVLLTNAAGGINRLLSPGSLMLIEGHVVFGSPRVHECARGSEDAQDSDDVSRYDPALLTIASEAALDLGIPLARGVYACVLGPSYETPAEVRALSRLGADAVGMSTVPEVLAASALGMSCMAISLITNHAAGLAVGTLSHDDVLSVGRAGGAKLGALMRRIVERLPT